MDLKRFFNAQYAMVAAAVKQTEGNWKPEAVFTPSEWDQRLIQLSRPHLAKAAFVGAGMAQIQNGRKDAFDDILITLPENVQAAIRNTLDETFEQGYWSDINRVTAHRLRLAFEESLNNGYNLREQIACIGRFIGPDRNGNRALVAARTETTGGLNSGHYAVMQDLYDDGLASGMAWLATIDEHTRESHRLANGQKVAAGQEFKLVNMQTGQTESAPYPGWHKLSAANRVLCRCTTTGITADSAVPALRLEGEPVLVGSG